MSNIIIEVNGIEVPYVQADLRFRESNNSFTDSLELPHAKWPIRITENAQTVAALGAASITASRKTRNYDAIVTIGQNRYSATLEVIDNFITYRKADLSYSNSLKEVLSSKLYEFMPPINLLGDDPELIPYSDKADDVLNAQSAWNTIATTQVLRTFPQVNWTLPVINHEDRIEQGKKEIGEDYAFYKELINNRDANGDLLINDFTVNTTEFEVRNRNIVAPQVFVMAPILLAVESIGYTLTGSAAYHPLLKSLLFYSEEDNMSAIQFKTPGTIFPALTPNWEFVWFSLNLPAYRKTTTLAAPSSGNHTINIKFEWPPTTVTNRTVVIEVLWQGSVIFSTQLADPFEFQQQVGLDIDGAEVGDNIVVRLTQLQQNPAPSLVEVEIVKDQQEGVFYDVHPTLNFRRYLPDWTISELIDNLKLFNIKSTIDDVSKTLNLTFNEADYLYKRDAVVIKGDRNLRNFRNVSFDSIALKYNNEDDFYVLVNQDGPITNGTIDSKASEIVIDFNKVPHDGSTALINEEYLDKDGIGLLLYNPFNAPRISSNVNGITLDINGENGLYKNFHKAWLSFLLDGSSLNLDIHVTATFLRTILDKQDVFVNGIRFLVTESDYVSQGVNRYKLSLTLISVNI